ncbi:MAG TPA: 4-hydroxythreonine-4-phosphate dehydrogenase PdxA [Caulobacterales bacterium]|nr:4-hydroxythreonine-4-phosphate dehydrogenase PdxA [Caulobacterales bacterium]
MKPLAVSMGDPAGIGLELAAKAWSQREALGLPPFFLIGDSDAFARAAARAGLATPALNVAATADALEFTSSALTVLETPLALEEEPGAPEPVNARATIAAIEQGVAAVRTGAAAALVTLPIAKAPLYGAGFAFPGHTEFIADLTRGDPWPRTRGPVMLLAGPSLKVALVTIHAPLAKVPGLLSIERVRDAVLVFAEALRADFGVANPRIALCGLNPHAGEQGEIGREEIEIINPAAASLRDDGWDVADARAADSLFHEDARARYDGVVALYHDQGLIPLKTLHFWDAVNVTLGLPIVRTSPDHGAGFDIAGKGRARPDSFIAALRMARDIAARRAAGA